MARRALLGLLMTATVLGMQVPAFAADDDSIRARDDKIADLERKLDVVVDELSRLRAQVAVPEEKELTSLYGFGPAASKVYGLERGLSIGGYGEANYRNFFGSTDSDDLDRADALRTVLYFGYKFNESIVFNSEIEFEHGTTSNVGNGAGGGSVSVELASLDFFLREEVNARAGLLLVPMGFINEIHEPPFFYGVQRPEVERRIIPTTWRENGAGIFGQLGESLQYRAYVMSGFNGQNFTDAGIRSGRQQGNRSLTEDFAFVMRADYTPDFVPGLQVGGSFYIGESGQDVRIGGERLPDSRLTMGEIHAEYKRGPLKMRGLLAISSIDEAGALNRALDRPTDKPIAELMIGGYAEAGYDIWSWFFEGDGSKRLEPFFRVEYIDTQAQVPDGFARNSSRRRWLFTPGVSFYPHPNVVIKAEYRNFQTASGDSPQELAFGIGFAF
ncbi:MAG: hypothetical protein QNK05_04595 [Myxococcota bacterium]|nr:hypothetical protein [Myxococcota bacterium]